MSLPYRAALFWGYMEDIGLFVWLTYIYPGSASSHSPPHPPEMENIIQSPDCFSVQELAIAATGNTQFLTDYTWFRRRTYWLRY